MAKIFLFGKSGMLGNYVFSYLLNNRYHIISIDREQYDIETNNINKLENTLISNNISKDDVIVNCAGIIPQNYLNNNNNISKYMIVNSIFPTYLSIISDKYKLHFIHITTDCVYDGLKGYYSIYDCKNATDIYGISKSLGEPKTATIIRTSIIGEELKNKKSLIEWIISNKNGEINGYTNHYWNGVTCLTLAKIIFTMIKENKYWKGVKHIYSPDTVTKFDLCNFINEVYNLNITIKEYESPTEKNMTLISLYNDFVIDNIKEQIIQQKNYIS